MQNYTRLKLACNTTNVSMSIVICLSPLLFITFRETYGISYSMLGLLVVRSRNPIWNDCRRACLVSAFIGDDTGCGASGSGPFDRKNGLRGWNRSDDDRGNDWISRESCGAVPWIFFGILALRGSFGDSKGQKT